MIETPDSSQSAVAPDLNLEGREVSVAFPDLTLANMEGAVNAMRGRDVPWHAPLRLTVHPDGVVQLLYSEEADHGAR